MGQRAPEEEVDIRFRLKVTFRANASCSLNNAGRIVLLEPAVDVRLRVVDAKTGEPGLLDFDVKVDAPDAPNQAFRREQPLLMARRRLSPDSLRPGEGTLSTQNRRWQLRTGAGICLFRSDEPHVRETVRLDLPRGLRGTRLSDGAV